MSVSKRNTRAKEIIPGRLVATQDCYRYYIKCDTNGINPIKDTLKNLNIFKNKHIPDIYMNACEEDRYKLLAGLIDTDGHLKSRISNGIQSSWSYHFVQSEVHTKLVFQTYELAKSLGLHVSKINTVNKTPINAETYKDGKKIHVHYYFTMSGENIKNIPCLINRKKANIKCANTQFRKANTSMLKVTLINVVNKYIGISVDDNSTFLLSDCTVVQSTIC
jgi:replicative DNA helicase